MIYPDPSSAAANAVVNWIAGAAEKSRKYKIDGYTVIFKAHKSYGIIGIVSTIVGLAALLFVPDLVPSLVLGGIFGILGILIVLYGFVMSVSMDPDKIVYRGPLGIKRQILWNDVKSISTVSEQGDMMVSSRYGRIRIFAYLAGFADIKKLIRSRFPLSFDVEAAIAAGESSQFENEIGGSVFRLKKVTAVIGLALVAATLPAAIFGIPLGNARDVLAVASVVAFMILGLLLMLYGFVTRLYIDSDKLMYRTMFGHEKTISFDDIQSVKISGEPQHECLVISSGLTRVKIRIDFKGYYIIKDLILKRCETLAQSAGEQPE